MKSPMFVAKHEGFSMFFLGLGPDSKKVWENQLFRVQIFVTLKWASAKAILRQRSGGCVEGEVKGAGFMSPSVSMFPCSSSFILFEFLFIFHTSYKSISFRIFRVQSTLRFSLKIWKAHLPLSRSHKAALAQEDKNVEELAQVLGP